uniref:endogenous retrovirus group PABLB member 1 Env polyprotein-like n=1 Tax=Pristiophorus japonicus TaxID=55135 RepID=UPI00398F4757
MQIRERKGGSKEGSQRSGGVLYRYHMNDHGEVTKWESAGDPISQMSQGWYQPIYDCGKEPPFLALTNTSGIGRPTGDICRTRNDTSNKGHIIGYSKCPHNLNITTGARVTILSHLPNKTGGGLWAQSWDPEAIYQKAAFNGTYFVCGHKAYPWLPRRWTGSCYLRYVVPFVRQVRTLVEAHASSRYKRAITPVDKFFGVMMFPIRIRRLTDEVQNLETILEQIANNTAEALEGITAEMVAIRTVALQNRMALDYLLAEKGGTCALIGSECCTYIPDSSENITNLADHIRREVKKLSTPAEGSNWFDGLSDGSWRSYLMHGAIILIVVIITCCLIVGCLNLCCKVMMARLVNPLVVKGSRVMIQRTKELIDTNNNMIQEIECERMNAILLE